MLNTKVQANQSLSTPTTYTQYSQKGLSFILASGIFLFLKTTGNGWPLGAAAAEAAEIGEANTDTLNSIALREENTLQSQSPHHFQHRSLEQTTPQSDTIIEGNIIGQLSLNTEITDYTVRNNYAYVTAGESGFHIIDVTDASNPITVGQYNTTGFAHQLQLVGNYTYIAYDLAGLRIIDVSDVYNPFLAGVYMTQDGPINKGSITQLAIAGNAAVMSIADYTGLKAIDVSVPTQVFRVYHNTPDYTRGVTVVGAMAYVADGGSGLQIIDISNPSNPQLVGSYNTPGSAHAVTVVGNLAYVADWEAGLQIIDISNPLNPQFVGSCYTPYYALCITVRGDLAYVADDTSGLQIIDISNSANPQLVGSYNTPGSARGVTVVGAMAYVADSLSGLQIIDISNPANPQLVGSYNTPGSAYGVTVVGAMAYVADGLSGLQIIDISDSSNPQFMGSYDTSSSARGITVVGNLAYVADFTSGLQIIDISNPSNPQLVGSYNTPGSANAVTVVGNLAYVAAGDSGLRIIDVVRAPQSYALAFYNHRSITQLYSHLNYLFYTLPNVGLTSAYNKDLLCRGYDTPDSAKGVTIVDNLAYVADGGSGLQIIDISDLKNPQFVGSFDTTSNAYSVAVFGDTVYIGGLSGLKIIDISKPANPQLVGSYDTIGRADAVIVVGNLAYVADSLSGLRIIDINNPSNPQLIGSYNMPDGVHNVIVLGNLAYVADGRPGLQIIDINNPTNPQLVGSYNTPDYANAVTVVGNLAYVTGWREAGLQIIDISDSRNPQFMGSYDTSSSARGITVVGNLAYVADAASGLQIIDSSNPTRLQFVGGFNFTGDVQDVYIANNIAYLAIAGAGLQIIDLSFQDNTFATEGMPSYITAFGDIAYLTDTHKNLYIIDIANPSNMAEINRYQLVFYALDIDFFDNYLYVAQGVDGIEIIDVQNPYAAIQVSHNITDMGDIRNLEIDNNRLYIEDSSGEARIIELNFRTLAAPTIINNRLIVNEGDYITITSNNLSATNTEIPDAEIEFIIEDVINGQFEHQSERDTIINRFTQQQLTNGEIRFASLSFKGIPDPTVFYQVAATNGIQSAFHNATIDFNARPRLVKNYLSLKRGETITLSSKELSATDFDDNDADLRFEITNIQHGKFIWKDSTTTQQFWQRNITDGLIRFVHDNSENSPSYQVSVYDKRMVVGNDTVRIVFDKASFTEADNAPVIRGGIIGGAAGLGLLTLGLFAVGRHINNTRSRKKHPFADYLARELKLSGVENFENPEGKSYLVAVDIIITALQAQGYDVMRMDAMQQKELAADIALTAKRNISSEVNCCGQTNIIPQTLQQNATVLVSSMLQNRLQSQQDTFEQIPLSNESYPDDDERTCLDTVIAPISQCCPVGKGRAEFV